MNYDVFISYSRKDTIIADRICEAFDKVGISYFIDRKCIPVGCVFTDVILENVRSAKIYLVLASKNSYDSGWVEDGLRYRWHLEREENRENSIILYIIDDSEMPLFWKFVLDHSLPSRSIGSFNMRDFPIEPCLVDKVLGMLER